MSCRGESVERPAAVCVLAIAWHAHPSWRLIVAANRDEYHDRAAAPLGLWPDLDVIAGRDLRAGGTWLGVSKHGRFAAVTNLRGFGAPDPALESRGGLIVGLLTDDIIDPQLPERLMRYNPLLAAVVSPAGSMLLSNRPGPSAQQLSQGIYALSNGPLDAPWSKTTRLKTSVAEWLAYPHHHIEDLLTMLRDERPPQGSDDNPSAIFVNDPAYGTRCSTLVMIARDGAGLIAERRYDRASRVTGETTFRFNWPSY